MNRVVVAYGDCSPETVLDNDYLVEIRERFAENLEIEYTFFGGNLGSAEGHNRLLAHTASDLVVIFNPDVLASPRLFIELIDGLATPDAGFVEARQLPVEHQKDYDRDTGETSWGSTACLIGAAALFKELDGFDSKSFFLYGDDVDLSWRARLRGKKVIHRDSAVVYHDKRLDNRGCWMTSAAERYYSAEAALMLTHKFSRPDLTETYLQYFLSSENPDMEKAAKAFETRRSEGQLPAPVDEDHKVGQFIAGAYAHHRFNAR
ncbi:glycosyltransferase family 2 protein [Bosea sp. CCNWLW174]|uniref:glycosyltransferase family 2 protein n=1 Tax=unclassified Bosea (in: a-proteobacteria) TaxID=2653178 RepID=UPI0030143651